MRFDAPFLVNSFGWYRTPDLQPLHTLERKKTCLMVKKDLERGGIPYKDDDGVADFHAAE
ncbi:hypothetical protein [Rubinisphaera italica]|uniref:hypothetical protein n=1 Tax=Rubinisphaera italica TaxID=2527969 RepID=UPI0011B67EFB|nr:hypothetical protein [Rubinisphaera italica]